MAAIYLTHLWVHDATNLANYAVLRFLDEAERATAPVAVRRYAGGRYRAVSVPGTARQVPFKLVKLERPDLEALQALIGDGRFVMIRTPRGRKLWGIVDAVESQERRAINKVDVAFTLTEVTHDEEV